MNYDRGSGGSARECASMTEGEGDGRPVRALWERLPPRGRRFAGSGFGAGGGGGIAGFGASAGVAAGFGAAGLGASVFGGTGLDASAAGAAGLAGSGFVSAGFVGAGAGFAGAGLRSGGFRGLRFLFFSLLGLFRFCRRGLHFLGGRGRSRFGEVDAGVDLEIHAALERPWPRPDPPPSATGRPSQGRELGKGLEDAVSDLRS